MLYQLSDFFHIRILESHFDRPMLYDWRNKMKKGKKKTRITKSIRVSHSLLTTISDSSDSASRSRCFFDLTITTFWFTDHNILPKWWSENLILVISLRAFPIQWNTTTLIEISSSHIHPLIFSLNISDRPSYCDFQSRSQSSTMKCIQIEIVFLITSHEQIHSNSNHW